MRATHIRAYSEKEREVGQGIANDLLTAEHTIKSARAIYPEYALLDPFGLHRPGVNLGAMMFLYRQVVAYVPPIRRESFPARFGLEYEVFLQLASPRETGNRFIFPVLNHPARYSDPLVRRELAEILLWMPPTWERWHEALRVTGGTKWFQAADQGFDYQRIWALQSLRDVWQQRLGTSNAARVSREIKQQVRNNYTDLRLVGHKDLAEDIAKLSHTDPATAYADLVYSSDLLAYPAVMGAGGVASVSVGASRASAFRSEVVQRSVPADLKQFDAEVVESMLEGLHFDKIPAAFRLSFLEQWHRSARAETARRAYSRLLTLAQQKAPSTEEVHSTLNTILRELQEFCRSAEPSALDSVSAADKKQRLIVRFAATGSLVATLVGVFVPDLLWMAIAGGTSGIFTVVGAKTWYDRERILRSLLKRHAPGVPADLYRDYSSMREFVVEYWRRSPVGAAQLKTSSGAATSAPVRTVWWVDGE